MLLLPTRIAVAATRQKPAMTMGGGQRPQDGPIGEKRLFGPKKICTEPHRQEASSPILPSVCVVISGW